MSDVLKRPATAFGSALHLLGGAIKKAFIVAGTTAWVHCIA